MDYHFMSEEDMKASRNPILIVINEQTSDRYARAVGQKGLGNEGEMDWLIKDLSNELTSWGHNGGAGGKIIVKCDGEASITAVRAALGRYHGGLVIPEEPAKGESRSNGLVEEAGKTIREYAMVYKEHLEEKSGCKIREDSIILQWIIRWAAMALSRYKVGVDGKTAYERRKGRNCKLEAIPI